MSEGKVVHLETDPTLARCLRAVELLAPVMRRCGVTSLSLEDVSIVIGAEPAPPAPPVVPAAPPTMPETPKSLEQLVRERKAKREADERMLFAASEGFPDDGEIGESVS